MFEDLTSCVRGCEHYLIDEGNQNLAQQAVEIIKKEIDYQPVLEACCKRILEKHKPHHAQCSLDYLYDGQRLNRIHVKIDDVVHGVIVCGRILDNDNITSISYLKPYELILGEKNES